MKRLSKSASDISNCKKKTYSTSPEEEEREFDQENNYGNRRGGEDDEEGKEIIRKDTLFWFSLKLVFFVKLYKIILISNHVK